MDSYTLIVYTGKLNLNELKAYARAYGVLHFALHVAPEDSVGIIDIRNSGRNRGTSLKKWDIGEIDVALGEYAHLMNMIHPNGKRCIVLHDSKRKKLPNGLEITIEATLPNILSEAPAATPTTPREKFQTLFD